MDKTTALIRKADPEALAVFKERIENGEEIENVLAGLVAEASKSPGAIGRINDQLGELLVDEALEFNQGVFTAARALEEADANRIINQTIGLYIDSEGVGNMGRWVLGNIAVILEEQGHCISNLIEPTQLAYNTIAKSARTFREFQERRFKLPFAHHSEIAYAKDLPKEAKYAVLEVAEENQLPVAKTKRIAKILQEKIRAAETAEEIDWKAEAAAAHDQANTETNEPAQPKYGLFGRNGLQILHRKPTQEEVAEADQVFKISSHLKGDTAEGETANGEGDNAEQGVQEAVPTDAPAE